MRWLIAIVVGAVVGSAAFDEPGLLPGALLGLLVAYVIKREQERARALRELRAEPTPELPLEARVAALTLRVAELERTVAALGGVVVPQPASALEGEQRGAQAAPEQAPAPATEPPGLDTAEPEPAEVPLPELAPPALDAAVPPARVGWLEPIRGWILGANTVVRAGVLVLTVGVGLLVKYAAEHAILPLELRLMLAALVGVVLVVLGYRLRRVRPGFGTALQGGGVAAIYLVSFFAYYAYHLLPGALTLGLLAAIAAFSTILALAQDAVELAVFGTIGGFLAPLLASHGGGSHVALFSYYALLNAAIAASALYRAWRVLNWVGFVFTFGVASAWGALEYEPEQMVSSAAFLALFFAFYVLVGTLFALRRPGELRGSIDTTLTFGTPLAVLGLAAGLFHETALYLALWCVGMAALYLGLAAYLLAQKQAALSALAQANLALGVGAATLAIPFGLENALATALAWAAEATGVVWIGVRQQRLRTRSGGYALFMAALVSLMIEPTLGEHTVHALFVALIAAGLLFASACLERAPKLSQAEPAIGRVLLGLGFVLWLAGWETLVDAASLPRSLRLLAHAFDMLAFEWLGLRLGFEGLRRYPRYGFPVLLVLALLGYEDPDRARHLALPLAILASYWPLRRQRVATPWLHATSLLVIAASLTDLGQACAGGLAEGWQVALRLGPPQLAVALAVVARPAWPFHEHARAYRLWAAYPIAIAIGLASLLVQAVSDGDSAPLPYLPLLNPLDLSQLFWLAALIALARTEELAHQRKVAFGIAGAGLFVALNGAIVRGAHHWLGVPFRELEIPRDPRVQGAFSIAWTLLALVAMLAANRRALRTPWLVGAGLLTVVVAKLFLFDLDGLSSGVKIVTFLAVGALLMLIGYFAPVPPVQAEPSR